MQSFCSVFCSRVLLPRRRLIRRSVESPACFEHGISLGVELGDKAQHDEGQTSLPLNQVTTLRVNCLTVKKGFGQFPELNLLAYIFS